MGMTDGLRTTACLEGGYHSCENVAIFQWAKELTAWFASTEPERTILCC